MPRFRTLLAVFFFLSSSLVLAADDPLGQFDFRSADVCSRWKPLHDISELNHSNDGLRVAISGSDPFLMGPSIVLPSDMPLLMKVRLKSDVGGMGQVFYFTTATTEEHSVRFPVPAGKWHEVLVPVPALGPMRRFRIDPPGDRGVCVIERMSFHRLWQVTAPQWEKPQQPQLGDQPAVLAANGITLKHGTSRLGEFTLAFKEHVVACGHNRPQLGLRVKGATQWIKLNERARLTVQSDERSLSVIAKFRDDDGANWTLSQTFQVGVGSSLAVTVTLLTDQDRELVFAPLLLLHPGLGSHGERKSQGLFAGVEYLDDEPSSSTADLEGPAARRLVPDEIKLTFPLMAISAERHVIALDWEMQPQVAALFDSPDRTFGSGSHVMGLIAPGSDGTRREDGALFPFEPTSLAANVPLTLRARMMVGPGATVVPAIQDYWRRHRPLKLLPEAEAARLIREYAPLAAAGWLDTPLLKEARFAHAIGAGDFHHQPAGDAVWMLNWLANREKDDNVAARLRSTAAEAAKQFSVPQEYFSHIGHLKQPVLPLVTGHVAEVLPHVRQHGFNLLKRFDADGVVRYRPTPGRPDFSRTQPNREANGLHASVVCELLKAAMFSGDRELLSEALKALRKLDRYDGTVPRGAQTWEIPLHTPDILASAHLTQAYSLGYQLTGDETLRERADYWAWTGVPFVYLRSPAAQPIGPYATIAVLGATHWQAPVWIGLPVQWCGAVYGAALQQQAGELAPLADLIALSGMQQVYPAKHPHQGLLPDSFNLRTQSRNVSDINPGTLLPLAMPLTGAGSSYRVISRKLGNGHVIVHVPGDVADLKLDADGLSFRAASTVSSEYSVVIHGLPRQPKLKIDDRETVVASPHLWLPQTGSVIARVRGTARIAVDWRD